MSHVVLMLHALTGMLFILATVWVYVEVLNVSEANLKRIRAMSWAATVLMWITIFVGGYWYVVDFAKDRGIILKGPWPFAHTFFMETKEHIVFILLLLATLLPAVASSDLLASKSARKLTLWVCGLIVVIGIGMEGAGAIIAMGAKVGLLPASY
jgi:heme A synthase